MVGLTVLIPVLIPVLMLGMIIALGRYEEFILPTTTPTPNEPKGRNRHRRTGSVASPSGGD